MNLDLYLYIGYHKTNENDDVRNPTTSLGHTMASRHRVNSLLLSGLGVLNLLWLRFACLDALGPCVDIFRVAWFPTFLEPTPAAGAATVFAGFVGAALGTSGRHHSSSFCQLRKIMRV